MPGRNTPTFSINTAKPLSKYVEKISLADKAKPGFWDWATSTFLGDMVKNGKIKPESFPSLMGSSSVAVNADGSRQDDPDNGFAPPVAAFFRERGLDLKKMKVINDTMARDGEPITLENYHARQRSSQCLIPKKTVSAADVIAAANLPIVDRNPNQPTPPTPAEAKEGYS